MERVLGAWLYYRFRVERVVDERVGVWRAVVCTGSSGCLELARRQLEVATLPYAVIGAESNGATWNKVWVSGARMLEDGAISWTDWCRANASSVENPADGLSFISPCDGRANAWTVTRQLQDGE